MTTSRTGSANYDILVDRKSRYVRKRCVSKFDSPCLALLLAIILLCSIAYFLYGFLNIKKLPEPFKAPTCPSQPSDHNSTTPASAAAFQHVNNVSIVKCAINQSINLSSGYKWPSQLETIKCEDKYHFINSSHLFILKHGSLHLNPQLFHSNESSTNQSTDSNDLLILNNQKLKITDEETSFALKECHFRGISWRDDLHNNETPLLNASFTERDLNFQLGTPYDFVKVRCLIQGTSRDHSDKESKRRQLVYERTMIQVFRQNKPTTKPAFRKFFSKLFNKSFPKASPAPSNNYTNVLILVLSALSKASFHANLEQTQTFFEERNAQLLHGFNSLGPSLEHNLVPLLTGKGTDDVSGSEVSNGNSSFLWNMAGQGHVTLLAEDHVTQAGFHRQFKTLDRPPTDHYMRPFYLSMHQADSDNTSHCSDATTTYTHLLAYIKDFYAQYKEVPKFAVGVLSNYKKSRQLDDHLLSFLESVASTADFSKTAIVLTGGEGGTSNLKEGADGRTLFENSPFAVLLPPKQFQSKHPALLSTLQENAKRLTTSLDLHHSILQLLHSTETKEAQSLFEGLPTDRSCESSRVPLTFCTCATTQTRTSP